MNGNSYTLCNVEENVLPLNPLAGKRKIYFDLAQASFPLLKRYSVINALLPFPLEKISFGIIAFLN